MLRDNYRQNRALDNADAQAVEMEEVHARFMRALEAAGAPRPRGRAAARPTRQLADRHNAGLGLTVPELAVLLAYAKITLEEELLASQLPDDPDFVARARARASRRRCASGSSTASARTRCAARSPRPRS